MLKEQIHIKLPKTIQITPDLLDNFRKLNKRISFKKKFTHILVLEESKFKFEDYEYVKLKFPPKLFKNNDFDVLYDLNTEHFNFEQPGNNSINIKMGTFYIIGLITALTTSGLIVWSQKSKSGRVASENSEFQFQDEEGKKKRYMADVSYISYVKASAKAQDTWRIRAKVAPTLAIEIVSSKKPIELKRNLVKMQHVWIKNGTDIGIVVDSFRKKYYIFELNKPDYIIKELAEPFTHALLPGYVGDYSAYSNLL